MVKHFLNEPYYDLVEFTIFICLVTQEGLRLKIVTKGNGKDVLWSLYTLRFTISENFIRIAKALDVELFVEDAVMENLRDLFHCLLPFESYLSMK